MEHILFNDNSDKLTTTISNELSLCITPNNTSLLNSPSDDALLQAAEEYLDSTVASVTHPPSTNLSEINNQIKEMWGEIDTLNDFLKPQTVTIYNFNHLKVNPTAITVKEKVNDLLFAAEIPLYWKLSVEWTEKSISPDETEVDSVTIFCLNHHVKEKIIKDLSKYFETDYNNRVYM
jgi:hypothetical protein